MDYFCTYFDKHYLTRGLALYQSLKQHCPSFKLWVLCMDKDTQEILMRLRLSDLCLIPIEEFEEEDNELLAAKQNRSLIEYYFTCTPSLPLYIFNKWPEVDLLTYLDADLYFFSNPEPIINEINGYSIALIEHRFPENLRHLERHGKYNVSWLTFRRDTWAFECLHQWRKQCLEWCYDRCEEGRFADQKYLDDWPDRYKNAYVIKHKGANLAPWNVNRYLIHVNKNQIFVDGYPLIFFHFHGLVRISNCVYNPNLARYKVKPTRAILSKLYAIYISSLINIKKKISPFIREVSFEDGIRYRSTYLAKLNKNGKKKYFNKYLKDILVVSRNVLLKNYIVFIKGCLFFP